MSERAETGEVDPSLIPTVFHMPEDRKNHAIRLPIGHRYFIIEDGRKVYGEIIADDGRYYQVRWDDGMETLETVIDPATTGKPK